MSKSNRVYVVRDVIGCEYVRVFTTVDAAIKGMEEEGYIPVFYPDSIIFNMDHDPDHGFMGSVCEGCYVDVEHGE